MNSCDRAPKMYNLPADLFERGTETQFYSDRLAYWIFLIVAVQDRYEVARKI